MTVVEKFYSVQEAALLVSVSRKTVLRQIAARAFGTAVVNIGSTVRPDYRIPASALNAWLESRRIFTDEPGITARSERDLRRRAGLAA